MIEAHLKMMNGKCCRHNSVPSTTIIQNEGALKTGLGKEKLTGNSFP